MYLEWKTFVHDESNGRVNALSCALLLAALYTMVVCVSSVWSKRKWTQVVALVSAIALVLLSAKCGPVFWRIRGLLFVLAAYILFHSI